MRDNFKLLNFHISVSGYFHLICCASCLLSFLLCFSGRASFIIQHHHKNTFSSATWRNFPCFSSILIKNENEKQKIVRSFSCVFRCILFCFCIREMEKIAKEGVEKKMERCPIKIIPLLHHNHQPNHHYHYHHQQYVLYILYYNTVFI